ncbi:Lipoprotein subunit MlaA of the ABC-type intermembrane phospholipid transporter Mla (MlaA) (PDB:5NUQ) [Commensalibacter communis]|uniref:Lipoprotein subunit MlaA of the ABC-type intermembrane phospholipid transporter Mla (MlaA) n=2 Tax=Commensalibacter communis TaxID=2972786 RepID=A0A9W4XDA2_9PROT|nr:Lipoprotein subunit MlaA of the ABC-type intermembrane phospholipid transporter Mla (MlaA) (PDB:5NUQ) [Commensalibacter communis]CAI3942846.1 Lipoprotein subunit MlaA of the ABC-type intermembrane phospholipid transporter Mla (MlaA) (PDB:5NUQ) [Commensalibacter communis]CAI3944194.1 Lipoprotein subunit MlaA of the ABC-type intermembrane phospholipid transporter Mla (MlaA) (PDB:5NUQ) [Commensalibacter communis]CAI3945206.1 Lipoprotein subunit MlaA of the ABC-type intermembrane phospholipid tra
MDLNNSNISHSLQPQTKKKQKMRRLSYITLTVGLSLFASACTAPVPKDPEALAEYKRNNDKYEPTNREMYNLTTTVDKYTLRPVAKAYVWAVPKVVRKSLSNMITTMNEPVVFFSDVGAGKPRRAGDTFARWCINMVAGVGGFIDVASMVGYEHHDTTPGMTLASWGIKSGPYLFVPFMGPSSFREAGGSIIAVGLQPFNYVPRGYGLITFNWAYNILGVISSRADYLDAMDQLQRDSLDPYATIRSAYQQQQSAEIKELINDHRATTPAWYIK